MWICMCGPVNSGAVQRAIQDGNTTVKAVTNACGAGLDCRRCHATIKKLIDASEIDTSQLDPGEAEEP